MALTDDAIDKIKGMIVSGELMPGDRLPPEKDLAEHLGLSRNSMREAVKALEVIRVLDVRRGDGTYVTSLEPRLLFEVLALAMDMFEDSSLPEILGARRILEPAATSLAAQHAEVADVAALLSELAEVGPETEIESLVDHDLRFHRMVCELSGNRYLAGLLDSLNSHTVRARVWRGLTETGAVERTLAEHAEIVAAIADHDSERADLLARMHIDGVQKWLKRSGVIQR